MSDYTEFVGSFFQDPNDPKLGCGLDFKSNQNLSDSCQNREAQTAPKYGG